MKAEEFKEIAKQTLSEKRFIHTCGVADTAKSLACNTTVSSDDACISSYLHDIKKESSLDEMNYITRKLELCDEVRKSKALLHGIAAAEFSKQLYGIPDNIYSACYFHTFGRPDMTTLEKIIFVADMIEPSRDFPGVEDIRKTAYQNLDKAVVECIDSTLRFLIAQNKEIYLETVKTRNFFLTEEN